MARRKVGAIENGKYVSYEQSDSDNFADIVKYRRPPGLRGTDAINFKGVANGNPFPNTREDDAKKLMAQAKALGISVDGKRYMASLVRPEYRGRFDPEALVDSTNDVRIRLESRGWGTSDEHDCMVKVKAREYEGPDPLDQPYAPDDTLVHSHVQNELETAGVEKISKKEYRKIFEKKKTQLTGDVNDG